MSFVVADGMLTTIEASLLVRRHESSVREAIARRILPATNQGGRWLIRRDDLLTWDQRAQRRPRTKRGTAAPWQRAAQLLAEFGPLSAGELAQLSGGIHPGNARKHLAILANQGRAKRRPDGQWVLIESSPGAA
jgi:excisionase family DNA binding protein